MHYEDKTIQYWIEISNYDLEVAEGMLDKGYYLYVGFMCHQSIEKLLKAYYVKKFIEVPPYTHNLDKLIEYCTLDDEFTNDLYDFVDELKPLNIQARYPIYKEHIRSLISPQKADRILQKTKDFSIWLKKRIEYIKI